MRTAVGIFSDRPRAEHAVAELDRVGFDQERVTLLSPGQPMPSAAMPTTEGEAPGMGTAVGAAVGTAVGGAAGLPLGAAIATFFVPGVGPVIAAGLAGAGLLAAAGAAVGSALETSLTQGVPKDETFVYVDALRRGRSVVVALADDEDRAEIARSVFRAASAETLDAAREQWWLGLRSAERERYVAGGSHDFDAAEADYRRGFEAALRVDAAMRSYGEAQGQLREWCPDAYHREPFRRGFERGLAHRDAVRDIRRREAA